ncbi:MAG TPA: tetratricopeptide repeat protein [Thermodesulfovibrionales bacterium]|nr:tetratricopeptide repeat protein [Thermodesulfovibrionales bacterium]
MHFESNGAGARFLGWKTAHLFLIVILGFIAYSNSLHSPFVFDDEPSILENPVIKDMNNFFLNTTGYEYNPRRFIGYLTIAMNYAFGGLDVTGYHVFNLAVHIANALLVYALIVLTFRTPYMRNSSLSQSWRPIAFFSAALFAVHPVQTEAVTFIVQRFTSLATMFYLMSLCLYVKWRLMGNSEKPSGGKALFWYFLSLAAVVFAMKTKENAFTLPVMVVLYEVFFFRLPMRERLPFLAPIVATLLIIPQSMLNVGKPLGEVLSDVSEATKIQTDVTRWDYLMTQFRVIVTYVRLLFFPVNQNLDYDYPIYRSLFTPPVLLSFLFLLSLFALGVYFFRRSARDVSEGGFGLRLVSLGIIWFFITLSVESSIIPIADVIFEHRVYLPSVGLLSACVTAVVAFGDGLKSRSAFIIKTITPLLAIVVFLFGLATFSRNMVWNDARTLWMDAVKKSPAKARAVYNLGQVYDVRGALEEAAGLYRTAIRLDPNLSHPYNNLGTIYEKWGRIDEAIRLYKEAIVLYPEDEDVVARANLGAAYAKQGRFAEAVSVLMRAIQIKPDYAIAHNNLGNVYSERGYLDNAVHEYRAAIAAKGDFAAAHINLGLVYAKQGFLDKAAEEFRLAIRFEPRSFEAFNNLGMVYMKQSNPDGALREFRRALELQPGNPEIHANIGRVYMNTGNFEEALREFQIALNIAPDLHEARYYLELTQKRLLESAHRK